MNAAEALAAAREAGIRVRVDGDDLELEASSQPPAEVIDLLIQHKAAIVTLLRSEDDEWSDEGWRQLFDERAGILEYIGGLPHDLAEAQAFSSCVEEWLRRHPVRSDSGVCAFCNQTTGTLRPYLTEAAVCDSRQTWLHPHCVLEWYQARQANATAALIAAGIVVGRLEDNVNTPHATRVAR